MYQCVLTLTNAEQHYVCLDMWETTCSCRLLVNALARKACEKIPIEKQTFQVLFVVLLPTMKLFRQKLLCVLKYHYRRLPWGTQSVLLLLGSGVHPNHTFKFQLNKEVTRRTNQNTNTRLKQQATVIIFSPASSCPVGSVLCMLEAGGTGYSVMLVGGVSSLQLSSCCSWLTKSAGCRKLVTQRTQSWS